MVRAFEFAHHRYWQRELDFDILFDTFRIDSIGPDSKVSVRISVFPRAEKINAVVDGIPSSEDEEDSGLKSKSVIEKFTSMREKRDKHKSNL